MMRYKTNSLICTALLLALGCEPNIPPYVRPAGKALVKPDSAEMKTKAPDKFKAKFTTSAGAFTVTVDRSSAPLGADRFYNLVRSGFYNDCRFFRVVEGFVVQFGIPADPAESALWKDANLNDDPVRDTNTRGKITYATAGANTRTTQLFISYSNKNARLDRMGFAPFGEVTEGMDVVDKLYSGYGEDPDQKRIESQGNPYLEAKFPKMDYIQKAEIIP